MYNQEQLAETKRFLKFIIQNTGKYIVYTLAVYALFIGSYFMFV